MSNEIITKDTKTTVMIDIKTTNITNVTTTLIARKRGYADEIVFVDSFMLPILLSYKWRYNFKLNNNVKYVTKSRQAGSHVIQLGRFIMSKLGKLNIKDRNIFVHHKDSNGLNNVISNLELLSPADNTRVSTGNNYLTLGIWPNKSKKKYITRITHNGKNHYIGLFDTKEEAIKAKLKYCEENNIRIKP